MRERKKLRYIVEVLNGRFPKGIHGIILLLLLDPPSALQGGLCVFLTSGIDSVVGCETSDSVRALLHFHLYEFSYAGQSHVGPRQSRSAKDFFWKIFSLNMIAPIDLPKIPSLRYLALKPQVGFLHRSANTSKEATFLNTQIFLFTGAYKGKLFLQLQLTHTQKTLLHFH